MRRLTNYFSEVWSPKKHPYKIAAFATGFIAMLMYLAEFIYELVITPSFDFTLIINLIFYALVFYYLLYFNYIDNTMAHMGILIFMVSRIVYCFLSVFLTGIGALTSSILGITTALGAGVIFLTIFSAALMVMIGVSGIMVYRRCRGYLSGLYRNWRGLRNWALVFTILNIISEGSAVVLVVLLGMASSAYSGAWIISLCSALCPVLISACCYLTLLRMKGF